MRYDVMIMERVKMLATVVLPILISLLIRTVDEVNTEEHGHNDDDNYDDPDKDATKSHPDKFTDCGGQLTELEALVRTPDYPTESTQHSVYPSNAYCEWSFKGNEMTLVQFKMWDLSVQLGSDGSNVTCDLDYVEIFITSLGSQRFCGHQKYDGQIRGKGSFRIIFASNAEKNFRGLSASYRITEDFDPCDPTPCSEKGTCEVQPDLTSVLCHCAPGFTGKQCEINIQECRSGPCKNGGICKEDKIPDHYYCECEIGFEGYNCETKIVHPCIPDPCQFGGTCYNHTETSYSCGCPLNRTGSQCEEENFPPCSSQPCLNGGECENVVGEQKYVEVPPPLGSNEEPKKVGRPIEYLGFNCTCSAEYHGDHCEIDSGCGDPGIPDIEEGFWFDANSIVEFSCINGYYLEGDANVTCYFNGTWSSDMPKCRVNETAAAIERNRNRPMSPWTVGMIAASIALFINLVAFSTWMLVERPWTPSANRIVNLSQDDLRSYDNDSHTSESTSTCTNTSADS